MAGESTGASILSVEMACKLLGTTTDQLHKAARWSYIPKPSKAGYNAGTLVQGWCRYLQSGEMTIADAGAMLGTSHTWVSKLIREGYISKNGRGNVLRDEVVQGYFRFLKDEDRRSSKTSAASRLHEAREEEIRLRTAERNHRLVETEEALGVLDEVLGGLRSDFSGLPASLTRDREMRQKIESGIDAIFGRASARYIEKAAALRSSGEAVGGAASDVA